MAPHPGRRVSGRPELLPPPVSDLAVQGARRSLAGYPDAIRGRLRAARAAGMAEQQAAGLTQLSDEMYLAAQVLDGALRHCRACR